MPVLGDYGVFNGEVLGIYLGKLPSGVILPHRVTGYFRGFIVFSDSGEFVGFESEPTYQSRQVTDIPADIRSDWIGIVQGIKAYSSLNAEMQRLSTLKTEEDRRFKQCVRNVAQYKAVKNSYVTLQDVMAKLEEVTDCYVYASGKHSIAMSRTRNIAKYYKGPLVYEEYDGTYFVIDSNNPVYQKSLAEARKKYSAIPMPCPVQKGRYVTATVTDGFEIGDKNWLSYDQCLELEYIGNEVSTEALAEMLALVKRIGFRA